MRAIAYPAPPNLYHINPTGDEGTRDTCPKCTTQNSRPFIQYVPAGVGRGQEMRVFCPCCGYSVTAATQDNQKAADAQR